jgi:hypothetical protein
MPDFHVAFKVLLHAVNPRHGTDGFTSPPKEGVLRIFSPEKIRRLRPGLNPPPRNLGTKGQHATSRPPKLKKERKKERKMLSQINQSTCSHSAAFKAISFLFSHLRLCLPKCRFQSVGITEIVPSFFSHIHLFLFLDFIV